MDNVHRDAGQPAQRAWNNNKMRMMQKDERTMTSATETQENEAGDVLLFYDSKLVNLSESSSLLASRVRRSSSSCAPFSFGLPFLAPIVNI